jgi:hypothetical protein
VDSANPCGGGKTGEGAALASVRSVGVGSANPCGGGTTGDGAALASVRLVGVSSYRQTLCWRARQVRALLWPLFVLSAWAQPATVVADTTGEGAVLASVRLVGVGPASHCGGRHDR